MPREDVIDRRTEPHQPATQKHLFDLMSTAFRASGLSFRQRGILVTAAAASAGVLSAAATKDVSPGG